MSGALIASPDVAQRYAQLGMPQDAIDALGAIGRMSEENRADTPMDSPTGAPSPPWLVALVSVIRGYGVGTFEAQPVSRWVRPVYDGDRPDGLTDEAIAFLSTAPPVEYTMHSPLWGALCARGVRMPISDRDLKQVIVRATHRAVHRALAGEDTRGCKWCKEDGR